MLGWYRIWERFGRKKIIIYADFIDPFCYIGFHNLQHVSDTRGVSLEWRGFELNPDTPSAGFSLETGLNSDLRTGMWASVKDLAQRSGLNFPQPTHVPNTRVALELVEFAKEYDVKNPLIERIYQAYFSDRSDIGDREVLRALGIEFGLPKGPLDRVLQQVAKRSILERHREQAKQWNFQGLPGFIYRGKPFFGALSQPAWRNILGDVNTPNNKRETVCSIK